MGGTQRAPRLAIALSIAALTLLSVTWQRNENTRVELQQQWQSLVATEPNGDEIEMSPPDFRQWVNLQKDGVDLEALVPTEPNGDEIEMSPPGWRKWIRVQDDGPARELDNFQVSEDGKVVGLEPNGDVIEMHPPSWRQWAKNQADGPAPEFENFQVDPTGQEVVGLEPNGDEIEMDPPGWRKWLRDIEKEGAEQEFANFEVRPEPGTIDMKEPDWKSAIHPYMIN